MYVQVKTNTWNAACSNSKLRLIRNNFAMGKDEKSYQPGKYFVEKKIYVYFVWVNIFVEISMHEINIWVTAHRLSKCQTVY